MKKSILIIALLLFGILGFSQLNENAQYLRTEYPEYYKNIRTVAVNEWKNDNTMIVYEINIQSDAFVEFLGLINKIPEDVILADFMEKWNKFGICEDCYDYRMIVYEIKMYLKNSDY